MKTDKKFNKVLNEVSEVRKLAYYILYTLLIKDSWKAIDIQDYCRVIKLKPNDNIDSECYRS